MDTNVPTAPFIADDKAYAFLPGTPTMRNKNKMDLQLLRQHDRSAPPHA